MIYSRFLQLFIWRLEQIGLLWWVLLAAILILETVVLLKYRDTDRFRRMLLCSILLPYLYLVFVATVLSRSRIPPEYDLVSLDISTIWAVGPGEYGPIDKAAELMMNILMFVPIGYLLMRLSNRMWLTLGSCLLITLLVETLQLITKRGFFELADIFLNTVGVVIGWLTARQVGKIQDRTA